jgi:hypothetical protein
LPLNHHLTEHTYQQLIQKTLENTEGAIKKGTIQRKKKGLSNTHFTVVNLKEIFDLKTLRLQ